MNYPKNVLLSNFQIFFLTCCVLLFAGVTVIEAKIVFVVDADIFVMNDDGTGRRRLTKNTESKDSYPRWSPDGKRIAFTRLMNKKTQSSFELFVMNADGTDLQRLTDNKVGDSYTSWSPDGKRIVFDSERSGDSEVHVIDLETRAVTQLTGIEKVEGEQGSVVPDWSPDGTQIVYEKFISNSKPNGRGFAAGFSHKNIYLMSANGKDQRPLFPDPKPGADTITMRFFPRWSADGQRIVFTDCSDNGKQTCRLSYARIGGVPHAIKDIYDRLGDNLLTAGARWIEDDRAILFSLMVWGKPKANYDLYRYEFRTRKLRRLTRGAEDEDYPDWTEGALSVSPHGKLPTQWGEKKQNISQ